ncbi:MAG: DUF1476 domain-containing protein [Methylobacterium frigidaeris]
MTTLFDDRERAFENLFAHEEALRFVALARRNKLIGAWMCDVLGLTGVRAEAYRQSLVAIGVRRISDGDLLDRLRADLAAGGADERIGDLPAVLARCAAQAISEVRAGTT